MSCERSLLYRLEVYKVSAGSLFARKSNDFLDFRATLVLTHAKIIDKKTLSLSFFDEKTNCQKDENNQKDGNRNQEDRSG